MLTDPICKLGCGNSQLSVELHKAGYTNMVNIDISSVCVANMKEEYPELSFLEMDMTRLSFPDNSFDLVVEKATLDSLLVDAKSPWNLTSPGHKLVSKALRSVHYEMLWNIAPAQNLEMCSDQHCQGGEAGSETFWPVSIHHLFPAPPQVTNRYFDRPSMVSDAL